MTHILTSQKAAERIPQLETLLLTKYDFLEFPVKYAAWNSTIIPQQNQQSTGHKILYPEKPNTSFSPQSISQVELLQLQRDPDFSRLIAIDCEMCVTVLGKEVTRVAVIKPVVLKTSLSQRVFKGAECFKGY